MPAINTEKKVAKSKAVKKNVVETEPVKDVDVDVTEPVKDDEPKYVSDPEETNESDSEETKTVVKKVTKSKAVKKTVKESDSEESDTEDKKTKTAGKKTRKIHKDKASEYSEGHTKTEDDIEYIVKKDKSGTMKWAVVKKKVEKKRAPTKYNIFIGEKLKELRIAESGKPNTEYMIEAVKAWKAMTDEEKASYNA